MKFAKSLIAVSAVAAASLASAASVTVPSNTAYNGLSFSGSGTLSFSTDLLAALDTAKINVTGYGSAVANVQKDSDGYYVSASAAAPITALTIDPSNGAVLAAATTGGATQTPTQTIRNVITLGGSLTVTDLSVDLANKLVTGTIIGGNGVGTKTETLWTIGSITGATAVAGVGTYNTTLSGLTLTAGALTDFSAALGLGSLGSTTLKAVTNFGSITSTIIAKAAPVNAVPEPSTYALMGLGLVGMSLVARRRAK